jgi:choline transport protein
MLVLEIIIGILYIISSTAYHSFVNLTLFALNITTTLPQAALLFRGRGCLPERAFSLGKFGPVVNLVATLFVIFFSITFCFRTEMPVTAGSMNYLVVVMAIALIVPAALWWGGLNKSFTGPQDIILTEYGFSLPDYLITAVRRLHRSFAPSIVLQNLRIINMQT